VAIEDQLEALRGENAVLRAAAGAAIRHNDRLKEIIEEMVERPYALNAVRFLAEIKELDPPNFIQMFHAILVIRDSQDVESVRLAAKAMLRNLERLEEKLDDAKATLAASIPTEEQ
jgi:hypothetical protein